MMFDPNYTLYLYHSIIINSLFNMQRRFIRINSLEMFFNIHEIFQMSK